MKRFSFFVPFFIAILIIMGRMVYVHLLPQKPFTPTSNDAPLPPPSQAYIGTIKALSGEVKKIARMGEDFEIIDKALPVLQGEIVATADNGSIKIAMEKMDDIIIELEQNTEVEFAHLVYPSVLFRHRRGHATYITTKSSFSIRSLHALIELGTGAVSVTVDNHTVDVKLDGGVAKIAMIDANNDTHVWTLESGERAIIDDEARTVTIKK